jgi:beta-glucosidase
LENSDSFLFPRDFAWGVATAAYQIEGGVDSDGRGPSIWDRFCSLPGKIRDGSSGTVACDHYHRWPQDITLMQELGVNCYRFSLAWPRIFPQGKGQVNQAGLDFYDRLVDGLLESGITPFVTLFHWDFPQALQDIGGWGSREVIPAFLDYVSVAASRLGDRVHHWITINEPRAFAFVGHWEGNHAPGLRDRRLAFQVAHHLLVAHGRAAHLLHASIPRAQVGIALDLWPAYPADEDEKSHEAAWLYENLHNRWFLDALLHGVYPAQIRQLLGADEPLIAPGDMEEICAPIDFLGINFYSRRVVRNAPDEPPFHIEIIDNHQNAEHTELGWEVFPDGLRDLLIRLHQDYSLPAYYVMENGAAFHDELSKLGTIHDPRRQSYLERHLIAVAHALASGVPLKGYFVWSLMDNFEWSEGYTKRFGLFYTDYSTQRRFWKESAYWYKRVILAQSSRIDAHFPSSQNASS